MIKTPYKPVEEEIKVEPKTKEGYVRDYISNQWVKAKPEEIEAKQVLAKRLVEEYGVPKELIQTWPEVRIQKGSQLIGPADIVVFLDKVSEERKDQGRIYLVAECKRKDKTDGLEQLKSYLSGCREAKYGVWFNGTEQIILKYNPQTDNYEETLILPRWGEKEGFPDKSTLNPAAELKTIFRLCHNKIYAQDGLSNQDAFDEFLKLLFAKMADEKDYSSEKVKFWITEDEEKEVRAGNSSQFFDRINELFTKVKAKYRDVFPDQNERINLRKDTVAFIVSQLKNFNFSRASADAKGEAFQEFIHAYYRGEKGQFFTPTPVMRLAVEMLDPKPEEKIIDPACGTGGFLVAAMKYVIEKIIPQSRKNDREFIASRTKDYAQDYIRGIDINPRLTRVAKMRMVLEDDGHTGIISANSLEPFSLILERAVENQATYFEKESFDLLFTNPPFGTQGKETQKTILSQFELSKRWKLQDGKWQPGAELQNGQVPDILFIERCLEFLKYGGRMAIVLPDGDLTNSTLRYVREFIKKEARILAVVSLPPETFVPYGTGVKASLVFLQRLPQEELQELKKQNYPIFMAICEKIGYDIRGRIVYRRNEKGEILVDENGEKIIDTDVAEAIEEFREFKRKHKLEF
jgi:type I restriction enzyme M protein